MSYTRGAHREPTGSSTTLAPCWPGSTLQQRMLTLLRSCCTPLQVSLLPWPCPAMALPCHRPALPWPCPVRLAWPCPVIMLPCHVLPWRPWPCPALPCPALCCCVMVVHSQIRSRKVWCLHRICAYYLGVHDAAEGTAVPCRSGCCQPPAPCHDMSPLMHPLTYPSTHLTICPLAPCDDMSPLIHPPTPSMYPSFAHSTIHSFIQPFSLLQLLQLLSMCRACGQLHVQCVTVVCFLYRGI